ncbi:hypothetical protein HPP92_004081 [Vanilla planifolia]|uniref:Uncharacterized protein n=1 Tax=Vanilla planifolia TaxID=51239 RepID=A0A835VKI8_VANPL|nr:hypothetical protein HPP92_004081 [Vanilla planifolia]
MAFVTVAALPFIVVPKAERRKTGYYVEGDSSLREEPWRSDLGSDHGEGNGPESTSAVDLKLLEAYDREVTKNVEVDRIEVCMVERCLLAALCE